MCIIQKELGLPWCEIDWLLLFFMFYIICTRNKEMIWGLRHSYLFFKPTLFTPKVKTVEDFIMKLGCETDMKLKVVSVFGDDGNALAEAINQTFYNGAVIFRPSSVGGIWAAYCQSLKAIILMVEGIQTIKNNPNAWVLLKVCLIFHHLYYANTFSNNKLWYIFDV